jgi:hypothetical protein
LNGKPIAGQTYSAGGDVLKLSGANSGEGGNGDGNIGLHFDD